MRRALGAALVLGCGVSALAGSPEDDYWTSRQQAVERLRSLCKTSSDTKACLGANRVASAQMAERILKIVGAVHVEGFSDRGEGQAGLICSPSAGELDAVTFPAKNRDVGGSVSVTTQAMLRHWLADSGASPCDVPRKVAPREGADAIERALEADEFYGAALDPEVGFEGVADIPIPTPAGATLAVAKLGRLPARTDTSPRPALVVTVTKGRWVLIAEVSPSTPLPEIAACANLGHCVEKSFEGRPDVGEKEWALACAAASASDLGAKPSLGWGPAYDPASRAWSACERRRLPDQAYYAPLRREAEELSERLARGR